MSHKSPRDHLADLLAARQRCCRSSGRALADAAAILAAGWRPPTCEITDPAELEALPVGSVILAGTWAMQSVRADDSGRVIWRIAGNGAQRWSAELIRLHRSATVLHVPTEEAGRG
ncbi:hypothetical protein [Nocardia cyriacigeorgica]|uniref:hypothetical protein n=1 Tax=Nocardia cyriacigeorgica TaxID=135487 RepID=UPI0024589305|nr:hypothetical protein [Nocardia cyriacigeorgica]